MKLMQKIRIYKDIKFPSIILENATLVTRKIPRFKQHSDDAT